jgi:hypothetical protein
MLGVLEPLHAERDIVPVLGGHTQALQPLLLILLHLHLYLLLLLLLLLLLYLLLLRLLLLLLPDV